MLFSFAHFDSLFDHISVSRQELFFRYRSMSCAPVSFFNGLFGSKWQLFFHLSEDPRHDLAIVSHLLAVQPPHIPLPLEPGDLPLGEVSSIPLQDIDGFL